VHDKLEGITVLNARLLLASLVRDEENDGAYNIGADSANTIELLFALFHFVANVIDQLLIASAGIVFEILPQIVEEQVIVVV